MAAPVVIKKYGNRRLYATDESRYITMEELAEKIRGGKDVRMVDVKSGDDLTQATLTQIIVEGRGAARLLPVPLLTQLIRMGDDALAEFFGQYMTTALNLYLRAKRGAQAVAPINPFAQLPFQATDALARMFMGMSGGAPVEPEPPRRAPSEPAAATEEDVENLRKELAELKEAILDSRGSGSKRRKRG